jgi:hypothetical protein
MSNSNKIPFFVKVNSFDENKQKIEDKPSAEQPLGKREDGPNEKKKKIKDLFVQHLTGEMYSAILNFILMPHIILKVFLVVFLLVSFGLASYTVITLVLSYFEYGVTTTVRTLYETPAPFPKITICNVNQFTTPYGYELLKTVSQLKNINVLENTKGERRNDTVFKISSFYNNMFGVISSMADVDKKKLSHSLDDVLLSCQFNYKPCKSTDFSWEYDSNYGNCYSFNSGFNAEGKATDLEKAIIPGNGYGLTLEVYANYFENLSFYNSVNGGQGLIVRISNLSHPIDHALDGILISAGTNANLVLSREFKSSLPKPYSNCDLDSDTPSANFEGSELFNLIKKSPFEYTQKFCLNQCLQQLVFKKCNCVVSYFKSVINNASVCSNAGVYCSLNEYMNTFIVDDYVKNTCVPQCPLECSSSQISYTLSSYKLLGDSYVNAIEQNFNLSSDFVSTQITPEKAQESIVRLKIFYDSLSYTSSEESPQLDIVTLIANIGGNLGLFLGMSMFSFCELITTLIELFYSYKET